MNFAADIGFFYVDFGVKAMHTPRAGGIQSSGLVLFDQPGMTLVAGDVLATDLAIRFPTETFPSVRKDDRFEINGMTYIARENAQPVDDGLEYTVPLKRA
jgi:hypothetical protein